MRPGPASGLARPLNIVRMADPGSNRATGSGPVDSLDPGNCFAPGIGPNSAVVSALGLTYIVTGPNRCSRR